LYAGAHQELLIDIVKQDPEDDVRIEAVKKLDPDKNQKLLVDIAELGVESHIFRIVAIEKLNADANQDLFLRIARKESVLDKYYDHIRNAAIKKLDVDKNEKLFLDIAKSNLANHLRIEAIKKLDVDKYSQLLEEISTNDSERDVARAAGRKILNRERGVPPNLNL